jgi:hypothetical protein
MSSVKTLKSPWEILMSAREVGSLKIQEIQGSINAEIQRTPTTPTDLRERRRNSTG